MTPAQSHVSGTGNDNGDWRITGLNDLRSKVSPNFLLVTSPLRF